MSVLLDNAALEGLSQLFLLAYTRGTLAKDTGLRSTDRLSLEQPDLFLRHAIPVWETS